MSKQQSITILGATGSIGLSTLDVCARHPERYRVYALVAGRQDELLLAQCLQFQPAWAVLQDPEAAERLRVALRQAGSTTQVDVGAAAMARVASAAEVDMVMAAIVGAAGLEPTLAAAQAGKRILLANKETLVVAGALFMQAVAESGAELLPVDSEHNAVFQALPADHRQRGLLACGVDKIILTASGGPFRQFTPSQLASVTPAQACKHPNWSMGQKISVDSASLMNKGLEVIEAHWLFAAAPEQIEVVVHPQSIVHSMVAYSDGSVLAQLGQPDMRTPIAYAMAYPERMEAGVAKLDLTRCPPLEFTTPRWEVFPCLGLAFAALRQGGGASAVLNAANEIAVASFLAERIGFMQIPALVEAALTQWANQPALSVAQLLALDAQTRAWSQAWVQQHGQVRA